MKPEPRYGFALYTRLLVAAWQGGLTTAQVAQAVGIRRQRYCLQLLNGLRAVGLVRRQQVRVGLRSTTFAWWLGQDSSVATQHSDGVRLRAELIVLANLVRAARLRLTLAELAAEVGLGRNQVRVNLRHGRGDVMLFPVVGYRNRDRRQPVYAFEPGGQDVPPPPLKTRREQNADYYRRSRGLAGTAPVARLVRAHSIFNPAALGAAINP